MKKLFLLLISLLTCALTLASCGNYSAGLGNYTYKKIHIDTHHFSGCCEVKKWYESESGVEVLTKEYGSIFVSEGAYILIGEKCPICDTKEE